MALEVRFERPRGPRYKCNAEIDAKDSLRNLSPIHLMLARNELARIVSLFENLYCLGIEGTISAVIHEGLYEVSGNLVIFDPRHDPIIQSTLIRVAIPASGLAVLYPYIEFRLNITYLIHWEL